MAGLALLGCARRVPPPDGGLPSRQAAPSNPSRASAGPIVLTDALGQRVSLPAPATRVVSLAPNLTEIVAFVGGLGQLAGVTDFCHYPPKVSSKARVGGIINASFERILALKPDLVLVARGTDMALLRRLRETGVPVYGSDPQTLDDVLSLIVAVGTLLGREAEARRGADGLRRRAEALTPPARPGRAHPRALAVIELDPLFVAGSGSFLDDLLRRAGMDNAAAGARPWARWSSERVLAARPDLVLIVSEQRPTAGPDSDLLARLRDRAPWRDLAAVEAGRAYSVPDDLVTIPGPRLVDGLQGLVAIAAEAARPASASAVPGR
jgi:iron complex transport system substrate-binding protein